MVVKGVSNIVAAILLIAFVMVVASIVASFAPNIISSSASETEEQTKQVVSSLERRIDIQGARYNLVEDRVNVVAQNRESKINGSFRLSVLCSDGSAVGKTVSASLAEGELLEDSLTGVQCNVEEVIVASEKFPSVEAKTGELQIVSSDVISLESAESFNSLADVKSNVVAYPLTLERESSNDGEKSSFSGGKNNVQVDGGGLKLANK